MKKNAIFIVLTFLALFFLQLAGAQKNEKIEGEIFSYVDTVPEFVGGRDALIQFLTSNMEFPEKATKAGIKKGKVYLEFIVKADGTIANIKVAKTSDKVFDKEAVRLVSIMPTWKPAVLNGKKVHNRYSFPIKFGYDCVLDTK